MDDLLGQHGFAQCIYQRLQLYAGLADPLSQRRARDRQAGTAEDLFLPVQRQVVGELRHHHMRQQAPSGDGLADYLRRHRSLDQYYALPAGRFPTNVLFGGKHAWRIAQLFADILTNTLKLAAERAQVLSGS